VIPVALTLDQALDLNLPTTPLKETERRADGWRSATGREQTEIDALAALRPGELDEIARAAVRPFYDPTLERRADAVERRWQREADAWFHAQPEYVQSLAELTEQREAVEQTLATFREHKRTILRNLRRMLETAATPAPPADVTLAMSGIQPAPLFSTDDDHATACRKLIARKSLADMRR
jgi:hypothetical protein